MPTGLIARARSLWRGVRGGAAVERDMDEEFRFHMELRARDLERSGLSPADAMRRARLEFGSTERYKDEGRASRGLERVDRVRVSWLDFKLGLRMLAKYPGLTIIGGLAFAFAIATGAGAFEFIGQIVYPRLPLPDGDRVVAIRLWNLETSRAEQRVVHELATWREELRSVEDIGAYRTVERNLIVGGHQLGAPVVAAEIGASAFTLARTPPLIGRALTPTDEAAGAPSVAVIGFDIWRTRFGGDSAVIGRAIRLGEESHTIVGVMPAGFAFPVQHDVWTPLRVDPLRAGADAGPEITSVFGRLAPGATLADANAELATIGRRHASGFPATHAHLLPQALPLARAALGVSARESIALLSINVFLAMLLVLVFGNVALLVFARAATRESEIVVRSALGASRGRIIGQLVAEALVLGGVGAAVGLVAANLVLRVGIRVMQAEGGRLPFWFHGRLSPATLLYAIVLTLAGAAIAGVVPGLKVTRGLQERLRRATAGAGGLRFGGVWTAVIVAQVAVTVAFPVTAFFTRRDAVQLLSLDVGFPAREYLSARLEMDRERPTDAPLPLRSRAAAQALERRLEAEPGVAGATFVSLLPSMDHPQRRIEVEGRRAARDSAGVPRVSSASVAIDYFATMRAPIEAGRGFAASDLADDGRAAIVNRSFVREVLGGANPIGRRVRYLDPDGTDAPRPANWTPGPWYEIVGVVKDLGMTDGSDPHESGAGIYHPIAPGVALPMHVAVRVNGDPSAFAQRLRAIAIDVDPTLRLDDVRPIDAIPEPSVRSAEFWFHLLVGVSALAIALSLAGIYAVMAFTVARRTREIGIRVALGSDRRRVILAIFVRPLAQVGAGVVAGGGLVAFLVRGVLGPLSSVELAAVAGYSALMLAVCMLACVVPTRRALRVDPADALRADG
jgi:predicted permease